MAYCKLSINFAAVFNKLKLKIMKQKNLKCLGTDNLIYINWFLEFLLHKHESTNILSRTDKSIIQTWQKQIKETI